MAAAKQHGGKRAGAGRPKGTTTTEPTTVKRIPTAVAPVVDALVQQHKYQSGELTDITPANSNPTHIGCPLYSSQVQAGFPSPAEDYIEGQLDINTYLIDQPAATFMVRVIGESMTGAGILPNDILVVNKAREAKHNDIVIAVLDNELTVKRLIQAGRRIELKPENDEYPTIKLSHGRELHIWGVVTSVVRKII